MLRRRCGHDIEMCFRMPYVRVTTEIKVPVAGFCDNCDKLPGYVTDGDLLIA